MQGVSRADRELLDAQALVGHLVAPGSMFAFLAEHRAEVFPAREFADLFPSRTGRPSIPAELAASIMTLQALHDLSDRDTMHAVRCDIRWKVACGLSLTHEGFDPSTLVYWRRRLAASARPDRIDDAVAAVIAATGVLSGRRKRVADSTIIADAVATQDTVTQLISVIRRMAREVPGAAQVIAERCTGHDYAQPGKPAIDWDDPQAKDTLVSALVTDATALVEAFAGVKLTEAQQRAVALLALVAGQDVEPAEGSDGTDGRWRIARRVAPDRVISTLDTDARHTRKSPEARRDGYRAHAVIEPTTGLITDAELTMASGTANSDPAVAERLVTGQPTGAATGQPEPTPEADAGAGAPTATDDASVPPPDAINEGHRATSLEFYGDSAYGTGELRNALGRAGFAAVIKPKPVKPAVEGGFTVDDFTVDEANGTVTCPNGLTRSITDSRQVIFGAACASCPLRPRCTTSQTGRTLRLHDHDALLRQARRDWATDPDLRARYTRTRPHVERTMAQIATQNGRRIKLRYRGRTKNNFWLRTRKAALNLRRLINLGLRRDVATWVLA